MKKLNGMKKSMSSLENKKLEVNDSKSIVGGKLPYRQVASNFLNDAGEQDYDIYVDGNRWVARGYMCQ